MSVQKFTKNMKLIYNGFLDYIENEDDDEERFITFNNIIQDQNIRENSNDFRLFLHMILYITNNHHHRANFYAKVEKILISFKNMLKQFYSNQTLFSIFKSNKRLLLFLINEKLIDVDSYIIKQIINDKYIDKNYPLYFAPEIKPFINEKWFLSRIFSKEWIEFINNELPPNFEENRLKGENEHYVCEMIRNDSIKEFIAYVNKNNYSLNSQIIKSIYETNSFIIENQKIIWEEYEKREENPSLIEYAAYFGSIQIFQYLKLNNVDLTPSLWLYAIHSNNPELIHILEENHVEMPGIEECMNEAIKCHHNGFSEYIRNNYMQILKEDPNQLFELGLKYYNFSYIQYDMINNESFFNMCKFDYYYFAEFLLKNEDININQIVISKYHFMKFFYLILTKFNNN